MNLNNYQLNLLANLQTAFSDVKLEDGVGLLESLELESRSSLDERQMARSQDEKTNWQALSGSMLAGTFACFAFLDQKGMRFYLPAFLRAEVLGELTEDLVWHLCQVRGQWGNRFQILSEEQRHVVADILEWVAGHPHRDAQVELIRIAIAEFWRAEQMEIGDDL